MEKIKENTYILKTSQEVQSQRLVAGNEKTRIGKLSKLVREYFPLLKAIDFQI